MVYSEVGYRPCGREIRVEYLPGKAAWTHRFFDPEQRGMSRCPGCGRELHVEDLASV